MHLTWSNEKSDGECPKCGSRTVLIVAPIYWSLDSEPRESGVPTLDDDPEDVEVNDEVTGHFCLECCGLVSLSLNTKPD